MDRTHVPPWKTLLERKTAEHYRRFHPNVSTITRRGFLGTAGGLMAASQLSLAPFALGNDEEDEKPAKATAEPMPIPGGATAFGFHVHHNPLPNNPAIPLSGFDTLGDPSEIGDFNGLVLDTMIRGIGTGTGTSFADDAKPGELAFRADMGAMRGEYIGEDGDHHHGSFVFI